MYFFKLNKITRLFQLACFSIFLFAGSSHISAEELPLDFFIKHGDYLDIKLSPDGKHIAGRVRKDGTVLLYILDTKTLNVIGGVKPPENTIIHTLTWVNNERIVFEFARRFSQLDTPFATGELFAVNIDSSKTELLYGYRAGDKETGRRIHTKEDIRASQEIISILEDDPDHILIAEYPWVRKSIPTISKLNVYTGRKKQIERVPYNRANILADKHGVVRFISWEDINDKLHAATRKSDKDEWNEMEIISGSNTVGEPVQINNSGTKVYLRVDIGEKELSSLQELNLKTGEIKTLFTNDTVDLSFWESDIITNEPAVGISYPDSITYQYAENDSQIKSIHKLLARAFKGQDIFITSHTKDGKKLMIKVSGDTNPGEYYIFDLETKKADFLWANLSWIDPRKMASMTNVKLQSRDGIELHGLLTLPKDNQENKPPLIVIPHGGPHGIRDHWRFDQEIQLLANRGYAVLQVNFRGSGGYGEEFIRMGYQQWGGTMINDIIDATKWVASEGSIDKDKICIYGASYGGYAAMMSAIKDPDLFKCVVGYVGVYDLNVMYSDGDIPDFWGGEEYLEKVLGRDKETLHTNSPTAHADKLTAKIMLIHGEEDRRAPIKHAKLMRKALKNVNKDVTWLTYAGAGHGVWNVDKRRNMYTKLLKFLDESLVN